jgi:hypothetical protein
LEKFGFLMTLLMACPQREAPILVLDDVHREASYERPSLRLIPCRMRQRPFVLEHLAEITAIDPAAAGWAADEVLGLVFRQSTHQAPMYLPRGK